jgi:hypothetical protein
MYVECHLRKCKKLILKFSKNKMTPSSIATSLIQKSFAVAKGDGSVD